MIQAVVDQRSGTEAKLAIIENIPVESMSHSLRRKSLAKGPPTGRAPNFLR